MWITRHLLLGVTLALIQVSASQLYGQNSVVPAGQSVSGKLKVEEFEVATIKPASPDIDLPLDIYPNGTVLAHMSLKNLIMAAYDLPYSQIKGGPAWIEEDLYDVEAKPPDPGDGGPTYDIRHDTRTLDDPKLRSMLRALLEDRFQLKTHLEVKDGPVLVLERGNGELTLTPSTHTFRAGGSIGLGSGVRLFSITMAQLAKTLGPGIFHEPIIDKTGLTGSYDFQSKTVSTEPPALDDLITLILPAIKEMGLKLTKSTGPVTTLVIDQASHPSPN
jgi:uncharacterized protein (TIGR03435 family)